MILGGGGGGGGAIILGGGIMFGCCTFITIPGAPIIIGVG